ncbi:uncharacterized protein LOC131163003 [Malania oleifera]|uniref:uncharacterized protein LOC131163003 n=1 Tax=Malania oleifera TaxID=397392 RepID=UPI0025AE08E6|nr:uncharacterized protein LOC131163003 [Malania oleifera]
MKDEEAPAVTTTAVAAAAIKKESSEGGSLLGRGGGYKFWALAAILLLAFWTMFTGSVTLKWSAGDLSRTSGDIDSPVRDDLDILEMEEREKVVRRMWDVYTHSSSIRLPRFWQQAFEAAYENLVSDVAAVRDAAITEIAKISVWTIDIDPPPAQQSTRGSSMKMQKSSKAAEESKEGLASVVGASQ